MVWGQCTIFTQRLCVIEVYCMSQNGPRRQNIYPKWIARLVTTGHLQSRVLIIESGYELANSLHWTKIHSVSFQCKLHFIVLPAFSIFEIKTPIYIMNNNLFLKITSLFLTVQKDVMYKIWTHLVSTAYLLSSCF